MYVYLFKLVAVGERSAGNVDVVFRVLVHSEYNRLSRVVQCPAHLKQSAKCSCSLSFLEQRTFNYVVTPSLKEVPKSHSLWDPCVCKFLFTPKFVMGE